MKRFVSLILTITLVLSLTDIRVGASDVVGPLELSGIEKIDKKEIRSYSVSYKGESIEYALEDDDLDYLLEKFSNENLICINSEIGYETDAIGQNTYRRPNDGSFTLWIVEEEPWKNYHYQFAFDKEKIYVFNPQITNVSDKKFYNGWFKFKNENTYDELMTFLEELYVEDVALAEKKESDSQKNKVEVRDFKILYNGTVPNVIINPPFHWGVCSYIREGESEPVYVFYYGLINEPDYKLFGISETMEANNTVFLDNKERMLTVKSGETVGVEYDTYFSLDYSYKIQVDVADDMTAKGVVVHYTRFGENTTNTKVVDMKEYIQTGKLPSELFSVENNIKKEDTTNKTEEKDTESKQEEVKREENKELEKQQEVSKSEENKTQNQVEKNTENKEPANKTDMKKEEVTSNKESEKENVQREENKVQEQIKEEEKQETETEKNDIPAVEFLDVPQNHWAYYEIAEFSKRGIVLGYGNGYFGVNDSITYEHFGLLLERMLDYKVDNTQKIAAIREDVIVSLVKALKWDVSNADEDVIERTFIDCGGLKAENKKYIVVAIEKGLVEGYDGRLFADNKLTRAETVTLLARAEKF